MKYWIIGKEGLLAKSFGRFFSQKKIPFFQTSKLEADITRKEVVERVVQEKRPDYIINCSALADVDKAEKEIQEAFLINEKAVGYLGEASKRWGGKVIHFSTDYVFDGEKKSPYVEEDICNPINQYGLSKRAGEILLLQKNPRSLVLRTAWLFGFGEKGFFQTLMKRFSLEKKVQIIGDKRGSPTFCEDLVNMTFLLLEEEGIFHVVNQETASRYEMASFFFSHLPSKKKLLCETLIPIDSKELSLAAKRPEYSVLSTQKIQKKGLFLRSWKEALLYFLEKGW